MTLLGKIEASAAERLALPPKAMPRQEMARYKRFLKVEAHRLKILHRAGADGREICQARSKIMDLVLRSIIKGTKKASAAWADRSSGVALVAIGGYGRAELNPQSDIDIMFLHQSDMVSDGKARPALGELVDGTLYTLWDLGLKIGHSVRSVDDCVRVANADMQSKTALIEARRITGDEVLFDQFSRSLVAKCVRDHENEYIQMRVEDQASRRKKYGNSPFMQEPNIKNGCGGLRDYQNLLWMSYFKYRTRTLADLEQRELISESERKQLDSAYGFLLRVRNELHYSVGRPVDVLNRQMQPAVALNLGWHDRGAGRRLESFMREYYGHARNIDFITRTVERRLALLPPPPPRRLFAFARNFFGARAERERETIVDGLKFSDGEIRAVSSGIFRENPKRLMRVFLHMQQKELKLHPATAQLIRNQLSLVDKSFRHDPHVRETFMEILDRRGSVAPILRAMHEVGFLGKFLPEFGKLTCLVQLEFYHQYTADEHTLMCIEKLDQVWFAKTRPCSAYAEISREIEGADVLYLALLLHDSGKAYRTGKHEEVGGRVAESVSHRLGLNGVQSHTLRLLVENHLAMAQISQRRDLDDQTVIQNFARLIQTTENLVMLTLHTFADSMGTSDQLWNGFKDSSLWSLYRKTRQVLVGGTDFQLAEARRRELLIEEVQRLAPATFDPDEIHAHFNNLPPRYSQINDPQEIIGDLTQVHRFIHLQLSIGEENALAPVITWHHERDRGYTAVKLCTWDRERFFTSVTGCLTAAGLNILGAEILTRFDGIILDTFYVTDAKTGLLANKEEREKFEQLAQRVLTGAAVDLPSLIAKVRPGPSAFKSLEGERIQTAIELDNATSDTRTIIDFQAEDRVGLLYDVSRALAELNVNVYLAKILTERGAAMDTFYIAERNGSKILDPERQKSIKLRLLQAVQISSR